MDQLIKYFYFFLQNYSNTSDNILKNTVILFEEVVFVQFFSLELSFRRIISKSRYSDHRDLIKFTQCRGLIKSVLCKSFDRHTYTKERRGKII
jgi:hypothetical protein